MPITLPSSGVALVLLKQLHPHADSLTAGDSCEVGSCLVPLLHRKDLQRRLYQAPEVCGEGKVHVSRVNTKQQNIRP